MGYPGISVGVFAVHPQKGPKMTLFWGSHGPQVAQNTLRRVEPSGLKPANLYSTKCRFFGHFWHILGPPPKVRHSGDSWPPPPSSGPGAPTPQLALKGGEIVYERGPYALPCGGNVLFINFLYFYRSLLSTQSSKAARSLDKSHASQLVMPYEAHHKHVNPLSVDTERTYRYAGRSKNLESPCSQVFF